MPYKSDKQRRYMHAKEPAIAARWDKEYGGKVTKSKKSKKGKIVKAAPKKAMHKMPGGHMMSDAEMKKKMKGKRGMM